MTNKTTNGRQTDDKQTTTHKSVKSVESVNTYVEEIQKILKYWNYLFNTNYKSTSFEVNYNHWRNIYSLPEITQAIKNAKLDPFWSTKITPTILFRKKNPNQEAVDYIGKFINAPTKETAPRDYDTTSNILAEWEADDTK